MKSAQKCVLVVLVSCMMSDSICDTANRYSRAVRSRTVRQNVGALLVRLFDPMPSNVVKFVTALLEENICKRIEDGDTYKNAVYGEMKEFLLNELMVAAENAAKTRGEAVKSELWANAFLKALEDRFREKYSKELFDQEPKDLPTGCFASCLTINIERTLIGRGVVVETRGLDDFVEYVHAAYVILGYIEAYLQSRRDVSIS